MTVYVAEINGRAIAAFNAENEIQAEGRAASKPFRADLTCARTLLTRLHHTRCPRTPSPKARPTARPTG
jgi:hypothetical protein